MSRYKVLLCFLVLTLLVGFTALHFNARIQKLEQNGSFTVVCNKFRLRATTHNYEGYDCFILGGGNNDK